MQITIQSLRVLILGILVVALSSEVTAQSSSKSFGSASSANIRKRNSASRYSIQNIQSGIRRAAVRPVGVGGVNQRSFLGSSSPLGKKSKPFSTVSRGPTVSPYLALSAPRASASDYQSIIRPQQQQARANQRQQYMAIQQQRRLNQMAARAPYNVTGDENSAPTGHVAVFQSLGSYQNTGNYFPPLSAGKQR